MAIRNPKSVVRRAVERHHAIPTMARGKHALMRTKHLHLSKLRPGDMVLVSTYGSVLSRGIKKVLNSDYSHAAVYMGEINGRHMIKDFRKGKGSKLRPLNDIRGRGNNLKVMRWNATPKQMNAYLENVKRINGKYDTLQAIGYGVKYRWKKMRGKEITAKDMSPDFVKRFTCSEFIAEAAHPPMEKIRSGELIAVDPPLIFDSNVHREMVTPKTIHKASSKGSVSHVTEEHHEEYSTASTKDFGTILH